MLVQILTLPVYRYDELTRYGLAVTIVALQGTYGCIWDHVKVEVECFCFLLVSRRTPPSHWAEKKSSQVDACDQNVLVVS